MIFETVRWLEDINNLEINEVVLGTLFLGYEVDLDSSETITLYWWNWLDENDQVSDIYLEIEKNNSIVFSEIVNNNRFPKNYILKQTIEIPNIEDWIDGGMIIISHHEKKLKKFPCKSDFTSGPIHIPIRP